MTKREILDVFVRCLGFYLIGTSLVAVPDRLDGILRAMFMLNIVYFVIGSIGVAWPLALGWWFLKGAPQLFQIADPQPKAPEGPLPPSVV